MNTTTETMSFQEQLQIQFDAARAKAGDRFAEYIACVSFGGAE